MSNTATFKYPSNDPRSSKHARLFQRMYEQHGTPAWAGRLVAMIVGILIIFCTLVSYEQQIREYENVAADLGIFKRGSGSVELGRYN